LTYQTNSLSADVALTSANTYYTGPSVTLSAGTWLITGGVTLYGSSGAYTAKLWDGTSVSASRESKTGGGSQAATASLSGVVVIASGTPTWKISAVASSTGGIIKAACPDNGAGTNASTITAVKIAP
jgi:uncharacterized protein YodC (DUF2158 family)